MSSYILYRWFNTDNELLYVGITNNALRRHKQHSKKEWFKSEKISVVSHQYFDSQYELELAERKAIKTEHPKYNTIFNNDKKKVALNCTESFFDFCLTWNFFTRQSTTKHYIFDYAGLVIKRARDKYERNQFLDICFEIAKTEFIFKEGPGQCQPQN